MTCEINAANLAESVKTKSDQLNADDLISGALTGRIIRITKGATPEQPVNIQLSCWHVPWRPCKTERRVLIALWGEDLVAWMGRMLRIQRDAMVAFGGENVGGVRIAGASHIKGEVSVMLNKSKGKKARRTVVEIPPIADAQTVAPILLPKWAEQGNEPLTMEQAEEVEAIVKSAGVPIERVAEVHGQSSSWSTETVRQIVTRMQAAAAAKRGGAK
mgnify:FL=1